MPELDVYELVMKRTNDKYESYALHYHTLTPVLQSCVQCAGIRTVNTVPLYYTATYAEEMATNYLFDEKSKRQNRKDEVETSAVRKLIIFT